MAFLRYLDDSGHLQTKVLDAERFVLGRATTCQLTLVDDTISREHLRIDLESGGRFRLRDLGSRNKTHVNGELISETLLSSGDIIRAGSRVLEFSDDTIGAQKIDLEFLTPDRAEPPDCEWIKIKAPLSVTTTQVEQLSRLSGESALTARAEDIAHNALGQMVLDLQAERGFIALRGEKKGELRPLAHRALKRPEGGSLTPVSQSFVFAPPLQGVAGRYPQSSSQLNAKLGYAMTAVVAPLLHHGDVVGVLYVDRPSAKKPFAGGAMTYLLAAGAHIGALLGENARRLARGAAREGAAWMATLRRSQALLSCPVASSDTFETGMKIYPGRARCGDFADVIHLDEQRCAIVVIDGGGQGLTGIAQAGAIRAAIRTALAASDEGLLDPVGTFGALNGMIAASPARQILPCSYVGVDLSSGKLAYISAGTPPPLLMVAPGRLVTLDQPSLVLGVDADYVYEATRVDLPDTFRIVCHTDGLTEATSGAGEALSDQRLHEALLDREAFASAQEVLARIDRTWTTHLAGTQADDDALVLVLARG